MKQIKIMTDEPIKNKDDIIDAMMYSLEHAKITRGCSRDGKTFYTTMTVHDEAAKVPTSPNQDEEEEAIENI